MPQKKILLEEACKFARDSSYLFAIYEKQADGNFHILSEAYTTEVDPMLTEIMVKTTGAATDFNEFETVDGQHCFRLHNNFNVPKIIPVIKRD